MTSPVDKDTPLRLDRAAEQHTLGPLEIVEAKTLDNSGNWHVYLAAPDGRKIAALWGGQDEKIANARLFAAAPKMLKALQHCLGILCESGNLNNYRNLSDEELGKAWVETAKEAAAVLNEAMGITSPVELTSPDGERE